MTAGQPVIVNFGFSIFHPLLALAKHHPLTFPSFQYTEKGALCHVIYFDGRKNNFFPGEKRSTSWRLDRRRADAIFYVSQVQPLLVSKVNVSAIWIMGRHRYCGNYKLHYTLI
jgi:hypothetical protein